LESSTSTFNPVDFLRCSCSKEYDVLGKRIPWLFATIKIPINLVLATDVNTKPASRNLARFFAFVFAYPFGTKTK